MRIRKCIFGIIGGTVIVLIMAIVFYIEVWDKRSGLYKYEDEQCTIYIDFDKIDYVEDYISNVTIQYSDGTEITAIITNDIGKPDEIYLFSDNLETFKDLGLPLELYEFEVPGYIADNIEDWEDHYRYIIYYGSLSRIGFNTYKYKILHSYDNGRLDEKELIFKKVKK